MDCTHLLRLQLNSVFEIIDELIATNPDATAADVRAKLEGPRKVMDDVAAIEEAGTDRSTCRHCTQLITRRPGAHWVHNMPVGEGLGSRSCRAASLDRLGDWDDDLDKRWNAAPTRA